MLRAASPLDTINSRRMLARLNGANMNSTADQALPLLNSAKYYPTDIIVTNASISLTTAAGGIYTGAGKTGSILVAAAQVYSALTASNLVLLLTLAITNQFFTGSLFFSLTTAQGAAATADIYVFGYDLT